MAYITADDLCSFEGFIANILFLYDLLQCPTSPLNAMPSHFCSLQAVPFPCLHFLCGAPFQFSVMWVSSFQPYQFPRPARVFYKGLRDLLFKGLTLPYSVYLVFAYFSPLDHCLWPLVTPCNDFFLTLSETFEVVCEEVNSFYLKE